MVSWSHPQNMKLEERKSKFKKTLSNDGIFSKSVLAVCRFDFLKTIYAMCFDVIWANRQQYACSQRIDDDR